MKEYIAINAHHIGNMHIQKELPCEDFSACYEDDTMAVAVISDGHGDKNCFRSGKGAEIACQTTIELCKNFYQEDIQVEAEDLEALKTEIVKTWKHTVLQDYEEHPFTDEELQTASEKMQEIYRSGQKIEKAYGCTLIAAMLTKKYWFALQIGDGKCVAAYDDGVYFEPVPQNENCVANHSTSLCGENAVQDFMHYYSDILPRGIFVFSDGVEESFDQSGLYNCLYSIDVWLERGKEAMLESVNDLLPKISEGGSGDDVSLSAVLSTEKTLLPPKKTPEQVEELVNAYADNLEQCDEALENAYKELETLKEQVADKQALIEEYEEARDKAYANMEKVQKYKQSADKFWEAKRRQLAMPE